MAKSAKDSMLKRMYLISFLMLVAGIVVMARIAIIQLVEGEYWREKAEKIHIRRDTILPVRGNIYSCDSQFLAVSVPMFEIRMDVASDNITDELFYKKIDTLSWCLSNLFGDRSAVQYKRMLVAARNAGDRYKRIKRNVTYEQVKQLKNFPLFSLGKDAGGLIIIESPRRERPFKELAARTIGYDRKGNDFDVGIEGAYSTLLSGKKGIRVEQRIGKDNWRPLSDEFEVEPENGFDLVSTIDVQLQDIAHKALEDQLITQDADHGCCVLMEVKTGYVRAIVNLTRVDEGVYQERKNHAIYESGDPGSTFKLASVMALLEDNLASPEQLVETGNGEYRFYSKIMKDSRRGGYGTISLRTAFIVSSNIGIARTVHDAYVHNQQAFVDRLRAMSLNKPLQLEIAGESRPFILYPGHKRWSNLALPWMAIGYGIKITPLQTLTLYNAVANNGCMVKPKFVQEIRKSGQVVKTNQPEVIIQKIASDRTIRAAREFLEGVVHHDSGTARSIRSDMYRIAGKTGTAQTAINNQGYQRRNYKASFVGYFPADDPQYSCIVMINNPKKKAYYGGTIAAPVFKQIADRVYAYKCSSGETINPEPTDDTVTIYGHQPEISAILASIGLKRNALPDNPWLQTTLTKQELLAFAQPKNSQGVPDVTGMTAKDAVYYLERLGYRTKIQGKGLVTCQIPEPGTSVNPPEVVELILSIPKP